MPVPAPTAPFVRAPAPALTLRAGPDALALLRARGLRPGDVDVVPGASGGAKWLALAGLDRYLFGEFFQAPRERPLHGIGSSIGSWRLACLAQRDPVAALDRGHHAYVHEQHYASLTPTPAEVSAVLGAALDRLLGTAGVDEILAHPGVRLHVITAEAHGAAASVRRGVLAAALGAAAAGNLVSRRTLGWQLTRCRVLLVAPSDAFVAALPGGKIPDRHDFYSMPNAERVRRWQAVVDASVRLGDELRELVATGRVAEVVRAL